LVDTLAKYRKQALKLAEIVDLGPKEGFAATIPAFRGLIAVGGTKREALAELESTLADWVDLALKRGIGLPKIASRKRELISA
jgi:predicted RNase H-like HicB family nuclease